MPIIILNGIIPSKKNQRIINKKTGRSFPSKKYTEWHKKAMIELLEQKVTKEKIEKLEGIKIEFTLTSLKKCDLTNKAESIMDLLVDYGLLKDDNWRVVPYLILKGVLGINEGATITYKI